MIRIHRLSVRDGISGEPADEVHPGPDVTVLEHSKRAVIMIHGFANSVEAADTKYSGFARELDLVSWPRAAHDYATFFGFHWPGSHRLPGIDQLTYPARVTAASNSGQALAQLLLTLSPETEVILVAHSLGCRVLLAALRTLAKAKNATCRPNVVGAHLLAAAVPVADCGTTGRFEHRQPGARYAIYYSRRDLALLPMTFGVGQWLFDRHAEAVGRYGLPMPPRWDQRIDTGLGHRRYWSSSPVAESVARSSFHSALHTLPQVSSGVDSLDTKEWLLPETPLDENRL